ncbi:MAG: DUF1080 domain-containing protein [Opitutaceae bacterium]|nr:DUF1080 domain-containing protein [Opitutaceae bacterium]
MSVALVLRAADFGTLPDLYTGNWAGTLKTAAKTQPVHATVIAYKHHYEVTFRAEADPRKAALWVFHGTARPDKLVLTAVPSDGVAPLTRPGTGQATDTTMTGNLTGGEPGEFTLKKVPFVPSPTLGEKAPADALALFDGTRVDAWEAKQSPADAIQWRVTDSAALEVVSHREGKRYKQDLRTKESFGDYQLHLEFKLAHKPEATGQGRSNSGILHHGVYETQILDSFGLYGRDNECGGIYKTREPDRNAGYPAGLWQTYDIAFRAPRFAPDGKKTADARMTVRLNGHLIHPDVVVPQPTVGGKEAARGPIVLQDHGNPVQFRNIWVVKLD